MVNFRLLSMLSRTLKYLADLLFNGIIPLELGEKLEN